MIINDESGSRVAVIFDTPEQARRKAAELRASGFEAWRIHLMSYEERVEQATEPPPTGAAGHAWATEPERTRRFARDLDILLGTFGKAELDLLTRSVAVEHKTLLVIQPGLRTNEALAVLDRDKAA